MAIQNLYFILFDNRTITIIELYSTLLKIMGIISTISSFEHDKKNKMRINSY